MARIQTPAWPTGVGEAVSLASGMRIGRIHGASTTNQTGRPW